MHWHDPVQFSVIVLLYTPDTTDDRLQMQAAVSISSGRATAAATTQHVYTHGINQLKVLNVAQPLNYSEKSGTEM